MLCVPNSRSISLAINAGRSTSDGTPTPSNSIHRRDSAFRRVLEHEPFALGVEPQEAFGVARSEEARPARTGGAIGRRGRRAFELVLGDALDSARGPPRAGRT